MRANIIALFLAGLPAAALANGYSVPNVNPRDLGLSGSAVAAQRDAAAVFAEPAALSRLEEGLHVALLAAALDIAMTWDAPVGPADASTKLRLAPPGGAYVAYATTIRGTRAGFGAGFTTPFGGNIYWPQDWPGRFKVQTVDRKIYGMYLDGAFEAGPYLRLGGGLIYYRATEYLQQALDFTGSEGSVEVSASGWSPSYHLAFEIQPAETVRLAFDYKHQSVQHLRGDAAFHGVPDALRPSLPDQSVEHALTIPSVLDAAVAWQARKDLLVTFTYSFDRYGVYREDRFVGSAGTTVVVPRDYRNGYTLRVGAEYVLGPAIELRAGAERDVSGMRSSTFDPSLSDASSWGGAVGASWHLRPDMTLDAALFVAIMDRVTASGSAFPGSYDIRAEIFSVGFTWRPPLR
jgi:long-chain fatty acid transport protein